MIAGMGIGMFYGAVMGLCVSPIWMMLQLPMRTCEITGGGNMKLCAWALTCGATLAAILPRGILPPIMGMIAMGFAGVFTGMISAALVEALEVIPALFDRLSISPNLRFAGIALALGKGIGAFLACFLVKG